MIRLVALGSPFLVGLVGVLAPANLASGEPDFGTGGVAFMQKHCLECHGAEKPKAGLPLHTFTDAKAVLKDYKLWEVALRKIENGEMPPEEQPQPSAEERKAFVKSVRAVFEKADTTGKPDPGRVPIRRLNRTDYANTVRDLLQLDLSLPLADIDTTGPLTEIMA